jgi:glyoxylase-like metal-dependent hydrolase (beta-lactamase superfamily II)
MVIQHFFDPATWTLTYVVYDELEKVGVIIDSVTDFDPKSGWTSFRSCDQVAAFIDASKLRILYVMDTHAHADHLTGMPFFACRYKARRVICDKITLVQEAFRDVFNLSAGFAVDGRQFDVLLRDGQTLAVGSLRIEGIHTPSHTPACMTYRIGDAVFVGDVTFMPDYGTARCDFPKGSADVLYDSIQKLYALPDSTRVFTGHDYQPGGKPLRFESTIGQEKRANVHLRERTPRAEFVAFRRKRDATLDMPNLIIPSVQVNIRAGELPEPESNGVSYLKVPLNRLRSSAP